MSSVPAQYQNQILYAAHAYSVPPSLLAALLDQESGFNANAVSYAGAIGIAQFMPDTAAQFGFNPHDADASILGAAQYLSGLKSSLAALPDPTHTGGWGLALAGYNAGGGAVQKYGGIPPFAQTQNYVASILAKEPGYRLLDATATTSGSSSPYEDVLTTVIKDVAGIKNQVADSFGAMGRDIHNSIWGAVPLLENIGPAIIGLALLVGGMLLLALSFGDDLADSLGKIVGTLTGGSSTGATAAEKDAEILL